MSFVEGNTKHLMVLYDNCYKANDPLEDFLKISTIDLKPLKKMVNSQ